ncbi:MAG: DNA polymerase III subunit tau [Syntrophomonadaceae bacterium]|nr:DNA polymerase III subunit tau [Bacillota bacterium]
MPFTDIIGQKQVIRMLRNSLRQARLPHALLFAGPEGVDRHLTAKILAQAINCEREHTDACGDCPSCLRIERHSYPDVSWLEPSGASRQIGIDSIRQLRHNISLKSAGKGKVYIISEADRMTTDASNALLKTLEEPPENSVLILITSSPEHLFPTVTSRCQMMKFFPLRGKKVEEKVCKEERAKMLGILDMASFGATSGKAIEMAARVMEITDCFKKEMEGKAAKEVSDLTEVLGATAVKEIKKKLTADISGKVRAKLLRMLDIVLSWYRDIFVLKAGGEEFLINPDRRRELERAGKSLSTSSLIRIMEEIEKTKEVIDRNVSPRLAIEVMMIRIIEELKQ